MDAQARDSALSVRAPVFVPPPLLPDGSQRGLQRADAAALASATEQAVDGAGRGRRRGEQQQRQRQPPAYTEHNAPEVGLLGGGDPAPGLAQPRGPRPGRGGLGIRGGGRVGAGDNGNPPSAQGRGRGPRRGQVDGEHQELRLGFPAAALSAAFGGASTAAAAAAAALNDSAPPPGLTPRQQPTNRRRGGLTGHPERIAHAGMQQQGLPHEFDGGQQEQPSSGHGDRGQGGRSRGNQQYPQYQQPYQQQYPVPSGHYQQHQAAGWEGDIGTAASTSAGTGTWEGGGAAVAEGVPSDGRTARGGGGRASRGGPGSRGMGGRRGGWGLDGGDDLTADDGSGRGGRRGTGARGGGRVGRGGGRGGRGEGADSGFGRSATRASEAEAAAKAAADAGGAGSGSDTEGEGGTLTCVVCCEEVTAVAIGPCGHSQTCAKCTLRLRLCYRDLRCPLCKQINNEVVMARPPLPAGASFELLHGGGSSSQQQGDGAGTGASGHPPQSPSQLWQQPRWAKGVAVYDQAQGGHGGGGPRHHGRPLHRTLMAMTSHSCCVCDRQGRRPFGSMGLLLGHLRSAHDRTLCDVCLGAGLKFPLEHPALDAAGLAAHMAADHPRCEYCDLHFYGRDELYSHMTQRHFTCHVCSRLGRQHLYFQDADTLLVHLGEVHHACEHPECFGCMIAFATQDELHTHIRERHSSHMPRWDQSRARPLLLDFMAPRGPGGAAAVATAGGSDARNGLDDRQRGTWQQRGGRDSDGPGGAFLRQAAPNQRPSRGTLEDEEAFPSLQGPPQLLQPPPAGLGDLHDTEGGLRVIDDDLGAGVGMGAGGGQAGPQRGPANGQPRSGRTAGGGGGGDGGGLGPGSGPGARLAGVWGGRQPGAGTFGEDFPELTDLAGPGGPGGPQRAAWGWTGAAPAVPAPSSSSSALSGASLRKVTVRCPCGRRVDHLALRHDEQAPSLRCDRECTATQRRSQLADAFGVSSADSHVSYFDRHRTPNYSPSLIQAAQSLGPDWVAGVERDLSRFLADPSGPRRAPLAAGMSQPQRALVHELAQHWGLATHSTGQGVGRAVQLLRQASSGAPTRTLSAVAASTPAEEVARLVAALPGNTATGAGWVMRLVDVAPGANVKHYLRSWDGEYTLAPASSTASAWGASSAPSAFIVTFAREAAFRDACSTLAGGVRGIFRTQIPERPPAEQRERLPGSGAASAPAQAAPPPGWTVLRSGRKAGTVGVGAGGGDAAAAVRSVMAADAWDDSADQQSAGRAAAATSSSSSTTLVATGGGGGSATEPRLPGRGPPLDLARDTLWAVLDDDGEGNGGVKDSMKSGTSAGGSADISGVEAASALPMWDEGSGADEAGDE